MYKYILKRLLWMIPIILAVTIVIFTIMYFVPGDIAKIILGTNASDEAYAALRERLGLNDPYFIRLLNYLKDVFLHFNFGESVVDGTSVTSALISRFPATLILAFTSILMSIAFGIPLGIVAAQHNGKWQDTTSMFIALLGISMPGFWLGLMLVLLFSLHLHWLPSTGIGTWQHWILPVITNGFGGIAATARMARSSVLEVIEADYVTTARAKGVSERNILTRHILPNSMIPVVTSLGGSFGMQMAGTIVLENLFSIPGIGQYTVNAIGSRDYYAVQGSVIMLAIVFSVVMLLVDIIYAYIDPRIKAQFEGQSKKRRVKSGVK